MLADLGQPVLDLERLPRLPRRFGQGIELVQGFQHLGAVPRRPLGFLTFQLALPPRFIREHILANSAGFPFPHPAHSPVRDRRVGQIGLSGGSKWSARWVLLVIQTMN